MITSKIHFTIFFILVISLLGCKNQEEQNEMYKSHSDKIYSEEEALSDIEKGFVVLTTYEKKLYKLNQKYSYTRDFGFEYNYRDIDDLFLGEIERDYEHMAYAFLEKRDSNWQYKVEMLEDSLLNLSADNFYKKGNTVNLDKLRVPKYQRLPNEFKKALESFKGYVYNKMSKDAIIDCFKDTIYKNDINDCLLVIDTTQDCTNISDAVVWSSFHYKKVIPELIKKITNKKEVGLVYKSLVYIRERTDNGDLYFHGVEGIGYLEDDLFTIAGRSNHILREITGQDFGHVSMYSTEEDLKKLQNRWAYWLKNLNKRVQYDLGGLNSRLS